MKYDENAKLYECDRLKCGKKCYSACHLTMDVRHAKNPEEYTLVRDLKAKSIPDTRLTVSDEHITKEEN